MFKKIVKTARVLRRESTPAEKFLWPRLKNRQLGGNKFLRQHPIKFLFEGEWRFFVADFYCAKAKLVIEIDGEIHDNQMEQDAYRTFIINIKGCRVIRFTNKQVMYDLENVLAVISRELTPSVPLSNQ